MPSKFTLRGLAQKKAFELEKASQNILIKKQVFSKQDHNLGSLISFLSITCKFSFHMCLLKTQTKMPIKKSKEIL